MNQTRKNWIIEQVVRNVVLTKPSHFPIHRACFHFTQCCYHIMKALKMQVVPMAGSASFQMIPDELDDGVSPTHYSYVHDGSPIDPSSPMLPEMHCWVVVKINNVLNIVDPTVKYLPQLCEEGGYEWKAPLPPEFLWKPLHQLPKGWFYSPTQKATQSLLEHI